MQTRGRCADPVDWEAGWALHTDIYSSHLQLNCFGISQAYREIPAMDQWLRRRVRMYYWKQWKRARNRRRHLIRLGIHLAEVYNATRSHRGYWWMAGTSIVQRALNNRRLTERGVPSLRQQWIEMHYGPRNERFNPEAVNLTGTA